MTAETAGRGEGAKVDQVSALLELIRWQGRSLCADYTAGQGLMEICYAAAELGLPLDFLSAGLCVLEAAAERIGASTATIREDFPQVTAHQRHLEALNGQELSQVRDHLDSLTLVPEQVLLLGDAAVMLGLYGTLRAFRAKTWAIGLPDFAGVGEQSITEPAVKALPFEINFGRLGRLQDRFDALTRVYIFDGVLWRVPGKDLMAVLLAARVGEPDATPEIPAWAHLAATLIGQRGEIDIDSVLELGTEIGLSDRVRRGLGIVRLLFPELGWVITASKLDIPGWERETLRPTAYKLVQAALGLDG